MRTPTVDHAPRAMAATMPDRLLPAGGAAFAVLILLGNSLTESVLDPEAADGPAQTARDLAAQSGSSLVRLGLALELSGLVCLLGFAAGVLALGSRSRSIGGAAVVTMASATAMVAVKLASAAPYLAALEHHHALPAATLDALVRTNDAAFMLCWLPFGLLLAASAHTLTGAGLIGRVLGGLGIAVGVLGIAAGLVGAVAPAYALPVPFLVGVLLVLVISVRLTALAVRGTSAAH